MGMLEPSSIEAGRTGLGRTASQSHHMKFLGYREFGAWDDGEQRNGKFYWGQGTEAECQGLHVA